ncbi:MAG: chlorophyll synthase ChlG [Ardenticatenaceae bacterium]|nr:chlorophyll synthase ChlG [Ardenticatenaceae bacterium]MCB8948586.1 chlorophyll synthase ChlG [Ardenticatenaceae bacterium]
MTSIETSTPPTQVTQPSVLQRSLILMKPITWFGPMWAFLCGAVASGATSWSFADIGLVILGIIMAGPVLCGFSQVINDYFDRDIDAVNEPYRLVPAGLVSTTQVFITLTILLIAGLIISSFLNLRVMYFVIAGQLLAVLYSAPPVRAKRNGWVGNAMAAISYEGLAWMAGHAAFAGLTWPSILIALLYSLGAHGIMSINDYKSINGDKDGGVSTIPVLYGPQKAAWLILITMNVAQIAVIAAFLYWQIWWIALAITIILLVQLPTQRNFLRNPGENYLKFSAIGVSFYVWGMMAAAIGLRLVG